MVEVLKAGLYDTVQDLGRCNVQQFGMPYSGAMDIDSYKRSNLILNNTANSAVLEITMIGPMLKFHSETEICITGANLSPKVNDKTIDQSCRILINKNDVLSFGKPLHGCRSYLSVVGGFQTEKVLNSRSMTANITSSFRLQKGDVLPYHTTINKNSLKTEILKVDGFDFHKPVIEVYKGPEFNKLTSVQKETLFASDFTISSESNRMAYRFKEQIPNNMDAIITSLVLPGTIQLTPSGQLLALMRDCQVTGGYPRIFQISESSINLMSQKIFGNKIRFKCIN